MYPLRSVRIHHVTILLILASVRFICCQLKVTRTNADLRMTGIQDIQFIRTTLFGCTVRIIQSPSQKRSLWYSSKGQAPFHSFLVDSYSHNITLNVTDHYFGSDGELYHFENYMKPKWILKRHTSCYAHLYFIEANIELTTAVKYHFVDFDLRLDNPNFIIFFDNSDSNVAWRENFGLHQFYNRFMDIRIYIKSNRVGLICIFCSHPSLNQSFVVFPTSASIRQYNIDATWRTINTNHHGLLAGFWENFAVESHKNNRFILDILWATYNLTSKTYVYGQYDTRLPVFVGRMINYDSYFIKSSLSGAHSPRWLLYPHTIKWGSIRFITVIHRRHLRGHGWSTVLLPFKTSVWVVLLVILGFLSVVLKFTQFSNRKRNRCFILMLFGPITDHFHSGNYTKLVGFILLSWSYFCFSLTILYGGEMASSLSILKPSWYPTDWLELGKTTTPLISMGYLRFDENEDSIVSAMAEWFSGKLLVNGNCNSGRSQECNQKRKLLTLARNRIEATFCALLYANFSITDAKLPYLCAHQDPNVYDAKMLTFFDFESVLSKVNIAYSSSRKFWVSPKTLVPDSDITFPWMTRRNYFAKLMYPLISAWGESGHGNAFDKESELSWVLSGFDRRGRTLLNAVKGKAMEFQPMELNSLRNTDNIFILLVIICLYIFAFESMFHIQHFKEFLCKRNTKVQEIVDSNTGPKFETEKDVYDVFEKITPAGPGSKGPNGNVFKISQTLVDI